MTLSRDQNPPHKLRSKSLGRHKIRKPTGFLTQVDQGLHRVPQPTPIPRPLSQAPTLELCLHHLPLQQRRVCDRRKPPPKNRPSPGDTPACNLPPPLASQDLTGDSDGPTRPAARRWPQHSPTPRDVPQSRGTERDGAGHIQSPQPVRPDLHALLASEKPAPHPHAGRSSSHITSDTISCADSAKRNLRPSNTSHATTARA